MKIGSMKEVFLTRARDTYLFDCRVAGLDAQTMSAYRDVLSSFILFTGNILVKQLTADHVRMYIANLSDGPSEGEEHIRTVINHYTVIHDWVRWLYAQKFITERSDVAKPPRHLTRRFFVMTLLRFCFQPEDTAYLGLDSGLRACNHTRHGRFFSHQSKT